MGKFFDDWMLHILVNNTYIIFYHNILLLIDIHSEKCKHIGHIDAINCIW